MNMELLEPVQGGGQGNFSGVMGLQFSSQGRTDCPGYWILVHGTYSSFSRCLLKIQGGREGIMEKETSGRQQLLPFDGNASRSFQKEIRDYVGENIGFS